MYLMIYQKWNGKTLFRIRRHEYGYSDKLGETTSMGWLLLDVQVFDKVDNKFYTYKTYVKKLYDRSTGFDIKRRKKEKIKKIFRLIEKILK